MAKYTVQLRHIVATFGEDEVMKWFSDYDLYDYLTADEIAVINERGTWSKEKLAKMIINHYFMREIGFETPAYFANESFSFNPDKPLVVITGGSQGSQNLNETTRKILPELLKFTSVGLVAGRTHYENMLDLKKYEDWKKGNLESNFRMWKFNTTLQKKTKIIEDI